MKSICIDVQPILKNRTGIGWYSYNIISQLIKLKPDDFRLNAAIFDFINRNDSSSKVRELGFDNIKTNTVLPARIYKLFWNMINIGFDKLFGDANIYHFFNYLIPPISKSKKAIVNVYDMVYKKFPQTMKNSNLYILNRELDKTIDRADKIITISDFSKKEILSFYNVDKSKIEVIYPGVDLNLYYSKTNISQEKKDIVANKYNLPEKYFLYLGTIEPRKNIPTILKAYANLPVDTRNEYKLVISGADGWKSKNIFSISNTLGICDNIICTGYVVEEDKPYIYGLSEIFLFPSLYEGFGMPVVEAMACGVPVITSCVSSLPEAGGNAAVYVQPLDNDAMSKKIIKLLSDNAYYEDRVRKGLINAQRFSWQDAAGKILNIYKGIA